MKELMQQLPRTESANRSSPEIVNSKDFAPMMIQKIRKAKDSVWIKTMSFEPCGHYMGAICNELADACKRDVGVRLQLDGFTKNVTAGLPNYFPQNANESIDRAFLRKRKKEELENLKEAGVRVEMLSVNSVVDTIAPVIKRDHRKVVIIDKEAYVGGVNFSDDVFNRYDLMLQVIDKEAVGYLKKVFNSQESGNGKLTVGNMTFIQDSGKVGRSPIYTRALDMINNASQHVAYISCYKPIFGIAEALNKAVKRGVEIEMFSSDRIYKLSQISNRLPGGLIDSNKITHTKINGIGIHAKALVVDEDIMIGSHNFTPVSQLLGTKELAVVARGNNLSKLVVENIKTFGREVNQMATGQSY